MKKTRFKTKEELTEEGFLDSVPAHDGSDSPLYLWRDKDKKPAFFSSFAPFGKQVIVSDKPGDVMGVIRSKLFSDKVCVRTSTLVQYSHFFVAV